MVSRLGHSAWVRRSAAVLVICALVEFGQGLAQPSKPASAMTLPKLEQAFNNVGITSATNATAGNFDGIGDSFSARGLAEDALVPGGTLLHDGIEIAWPDVAPGQPDNVVADGQTIAINGQGSTLGIIGASAYGSASGRFTITYENGTTTTADLTFSDWVDDQPAPDSDFLATTAGWNPNGTIPVSLSYAAVPLNASEPVVSVTLPVVSAGVGQGVTSLHVFDLVIGTPAAEASGAPGAPSYFDEARKDCVGTAADTASKVWFTVADGTLSDTYAPTIDNTNVKSLDPIVTGPGFSAQLQPRNMTYSVSELGRTGMACRVVALDREEHFAIVTDFVTNPAAEAVVMQVSLAVLPGAPPGLRVYLRFHPLLNGHGGGGADNAGGESATVVETARGPIPLSYSTNSFTEAVNRTYATPIYAALAASRPFISVETGFAGTASDGLNELDRLGVLSTSAPNANDGNVVQTVELDLRHRGPGLPGPVPPPVPHRPWSLPRNLGSYGSPTNFPTGPGAAYPNACRVGRGRPGGPGPRPGAGMDVRAVGPAGVAAAVADAAGLRAPLAPNAVSSQTIALGFGQDEREALDAALDSSAVPFQSVFIAYQEQWLAYDSHLCGPAAVIQERPGGPAGPLPAPPGLSPTGPGGADPAGPGRMSKRVRTAYWLSANVLKASEDKTFVGATVASLASPWGQSVPAGEFTTDDLPPYYGSYREVFPRDAYETFTAFLADGDIHTARQMVNYWFDKLQLPNGSFPRNGLLNGKAAPDTAGLQLDETADPILAAWQAGMSRDRLLYEEHIKPAADFLVANGPETPTSVDRWEEQTGYSPSTIADEVAGLVAAARIAEIQGDSASARLFLASADDFRRLVLKTTVTTNGPLSSQPYFIRVDKTGDPDQSYDYMLGNGNYTPVDQRTVIDQGFLELTRLGELPANNPVVVNSLAVAAKAIDVDTPSGVGVLRYNGDGYGDCEAGTVTDPVNHTRSTCSVTGAPWPPTSTGTGHPWPLLSGENGEYQILAGNHLAAWGDLQFMLNSASGVGLVPEQVWDFANVPASPYGSDPATASIGFVDGKADGSAAPLTWAQAQLLRLIRDLATGRLIDQPSIVADRYLVHPPGVAPLTVTVSTLAVRGGNVPVDMERPSIAVDGSSPGVSVAGRTVRLNVKAATVPGATVEVAVTGSALGATAPTTTIRSAIAGSGGNVAVEVDLRPGTNSIEVAVSAPGQTNEALVSVDNVVVPGSVVLNVAGPENGGYGPGTYAYPTATNSNGTPIFPPGSFQLSGMTVIDSGSTVTFQVGIANMVNTFGSPDGAQLVDIYIHSPAGSIPRGELQSTSAANPWNYSIAPADAWNQLIEVDGFGTGAGTYYDFGLAWVTPSSESAGLLGSESVGTPEVSVASLSPTSTGETPGVISITVPSSLLGAPTGSLSWSGWTFTVTLMGQDGIGGYYDARPFTATPGPYTFGVCSQAVATEPTPPAICSVSPAAVPYVMDTIPPVGVDVTSELDPVGSNGVAKPVVLQGVTVP